MAGLALARGPLAAHLARRAERACQAWRLELALSRYAWALRLAPGADRTRLAGAYCAQLRGDFLTAERWLESLVARPPRDPALAARLWTLQSVNRFAGARPREARELASRGLAFAQAAGDPRLQAQALIERSRALYHQLGRADDALHDLERALKLALSAGDRRLEADTLRNAGAVYWWHRKELERARVEFWEPALTLYHEIGDLRGEATTLSNLSHIQHGRADLFEFLRLQEEARAIFERIGDLAGQADSHDFLAGYYLDTGELPRFNAHAQRSLELARRGGYRLAEIEGEGGLGSLALARGDAAQASAHFQRAAALLEEPWLRKYQTGGLARAHFLAGDRDAARRWFEETLRLDRQSDPPESEGGTLLWLARVALAEGDVAGAERLVAEAGNAMLARGEPVLLFQTFMPTVLAELRERQGRRDEALALLLEAAEAEAHTAERTGSLVLRSGARALHDHLLAWLLTMPAPPAPASEPRWETAEAVRVLEQLRYRALRGLVLRLGEPAPRRSRSPEEAASLERIAALSRRQRADLSRRRIAALRRAYADYEELVLRAELAPARRSILRDAAPAGLARIQAALDPESALVLYVTAEEQLFAIVLREDRVVASRLPLAPRQLAAKVKLLRGLLADSGETSDWQAPALDLRRRLVEPLEGVGALTGVTRLGIVPYGVLHHLPFAALLRAGAHDPAPLVADYTLFFPPSASFLTRSRPQEGSGALLALGRNAAVGDLPPLRYAEAEAHAVATLRGGTALLGAAASEAGLRHRAAGARVLHFATHGVSEPLLPLLSRLELAPSPGEDGRLIVREVLDLGWSPRLVVLSACRMGLSFPVTVSDGDESGRLGLPEGFLYAGARSVVATRLPADDRSTFELMRLFYRELDGRGPAEALARAQRRLLETPAFAHPRHWAGFAVAGAP